MARVPMLNCVSARRTGGCFQSQNKKRPVAAHRTAGIKASGAFRPQRAQIEAPASAAQPILGYSREGRYVSRNFGGSMTTGYSQPPAPSIAVFPSRWKG